MNDHGPDCICATCDPIWALESELKSGVENWRPIPGWDAYEASDLGRVRSLDRIIKFKDGRNAHVKGRLLSLRLHVGTPYRRVGLLQDGRSQRKYVHQLVMMAFVGEAPAGQEVRHLDGNSTNNRLSNLKYGTKSENNFDQVTHGTHAEANRTHCPKGHPYSGENLYVCPKGRRNCRACKREINRLIEERKRAARSQQDIARHNSVQVAA